MSQLKGARCDLHIHSCLSPCADFLMTPGNIIKKAVQRGLTCIAITDHNTAGNVWAAQKLAERQGIKLIPAMEVETREEVHLLCYFPTLKHLLKWDSVVQRHLPKLKNNEEYFGYQLLTDLNDQYVAKEERLLATASELSLEEAVEIVTRLQGIVVPAHVDRQANSILHQLGFIPPDLAISIIEISANTDPKRFCDAIPELSRYQYVQGSDSHHLDQIGKCGKEGGLIVAQVL